MRIVLEKADLISIIGKYLEAELDPQRVVVRTDPFEVEVTGIPLMNSDLAEPPPLPPPTRTPATTPTRVGVFTVTPPELPENSDDSIVLERSERYASVEMPPFDEQEETGEPSVSGSPASILAASRALQERLDQENPNLVRQRTRLLNANGEPYGSEEMPPFNESES